MFWLAEISTEVKARRNNCNEGNVAFTELTDVEDDTNAVKENPVMCALRML